MHTHISRIEPIVIMTFDLSGPASVPVKPESDVDNIMGPHSVPAPSLALTRSLSPGQQVQPTSGNVSLSASPLSQSSSNITSSMAAMPPSSSGAQMLAAAASSSPSLTNISTITSTAAANLGGDNGGPLGGLGMALGQTGGQSGQSGQLGQPGGQLGQPGGQMRPGQVGQTKFGMDFNTSAATTSISNVVSSAPPPYDITMTSFSSNMTGTTPNLATNTTTTSAETTSAQLPGQVGGFPPSHEASSGGVTAPTQQQNLNVGGVPGTMPSQAQRPTPNLEAAR